MKQTMSNFFKVATVPKIQFIYDESVRFQKLQLKPFMSMAPEHRFILDEARLSSLDKQLLNQVLNSEIKIERSFL